MQALQRNQLVWLKDAAWHALRSQPWDAQAQGLLAHWHAERLPLVVCRQRVPERPDAISLGLPAPLQWQRRKLALDVAADAIERSGSFPLLRDIAWSAADSPQVQDLLLRADALRVRVQVYGSHAWQHLSGLPCVRERSDLDLLVPVPDLPTAGRVVAVLRALQPGCRVDGELLFPGGWAVAWREFAQLLDGAVAQLLVKHRTGVQLLDMAALRARFAGAAAQAEPAGRLAAPPRDAVHAC
jgi:phosphoribosyl-dephospho-CoA transferase